MAARREADIEEMVSKLLAGDRRSVARAITTVEDQAPGCNELMKLIYPHSGKSMVIGVTGSGGSGKSTLVDHLINGFRSRAKKVGVVAVDPSSPFSGGALLGDRVRFQRHSTDDGVYIRSMGSRGYLGGLARSTNDAARVMEAMGCDVVIVETLGAGQDEVDIMHLAQTCLLVVTPGMGDDIQAMKAGIMEIADIIVLNKADLDGANNTLKSLEASIHFGLGEEEAGWVPKVLPTVASAARAEDIQGMEELLEAILAHQDFLRSSKALEDVKAKRVEQELGLVFKDEVEKLVFEGLKGTGKKREYVGAILRRETEPYSVVEEVLKTFLKVE